MTDTELLTILKLNLQLITDALDSYLAFLIESAKEMITREGIVLDLATRESVNIVIMQASYLYNKRDTGEGEPPSLRWRKNNLLFSQKISED